MSARVPKGLFLVLAICASIYFSHYYSYLPKVVASHFDSHGFANGWETKQTFFQLFAGMTLLSAFLVFGIPTLIRLMPKRWINLPNKEYWLRPGQRAASMKFLDAWFAWFGCAVYALIVFAFDYAVQTNLRSPYGPNSAHLWYMLVAFGAFTLIWTIRLFGRFSQVPGNPPA